MVPMTHIFNSIDGVIIILPRCYPVFALKIGYLKSARRPVLEVPSYVKQVFEAAAGTTRERTRFLILGIIEDYNQHMGGVDIADQLHSYYKTQRMETRNCLLLFYWLLGITIVNSYLLYHLATNDTESYTCTFKLPAASQQLAFRRYLGQLVQLTVPQSAQA